MSIRSTILWLITVVVIGASAVSVWTLRQPIKQGLQTVVQQNSAESTVRFAVIGDNHGVNAVYQRAIKEIAKQPVDFLLNLADTSEFGMRQEFEDVRTLEKTLPFPVYHTVGNHDIKADASRQIFEDVFDHAPTYAVDQGPLHLIVLDNADRKVGFSDATLRWLTDDLKKNNTKTIVIAYHRPFDLPLSAVTGDDETATSRASNEQFFQIIQPYNISFILTGHVHTFLQYTVGDIPAVVSGGGGDPAQTILGGPAANYFHYLVVTISGSAVTHELHRIQL